MTIVAGMAPADTKLPSNGKGNTPSTSWNCSAGRLKVLGNRACTSAVGRTRVRVR
eukprot:gene18290-biopygen21941